MNTLILNLTRFGDLLQTQPVFTGYKAAGHNVGLVCLENFVQATQLLRDVDYVRALPGSVLLSKMDRDWKQGLEDLWLWSRDVGNTFGADTIFNLTSSLSVRLLARQLGLAAEAGQAGRSQPPEFSGFCLDELGFGLCSSPWATFLLASSKNRGCSPFNLVDLFWMSAGLGQGPRPNALNMPTPEILEKTLHQLQHQTRALSEHDGYVALQLGASEDRRRWPVAFFAKLGRMLHEQSGLCPVLVGSPNEAHLGEKYFANDGVGVSLIGKTSLPELAGTLTHAKLLVSNDTGTMHLAAGLGLPVVAIFLATAQPWDTGPYAQENICLEPDLDCHPCQFGKPCAHGEKCRGHIPPQTVFELTNELLAHSFQEKHTSPARIWETRVQDDFFMGLISHSGHEHTDRTRWVRLQRHFYCHFLDQKEVPAFETAVSSLTPSTREEVKRVLHEANMLLTLLHEQGNVLAKMPVESIKKKFLATWQRLQSLWNSSDYFNVLGLLWMTETQDAGENLASIVTVIARYQVLVQNWLVLIEDSGTILE